MTGQDRVALAAASASSAVSPLRNSRPPTASQAVGVVGEHHHERRSDGRPAAQPEHDRRSFGVARVGQERLQGARSGVEHAAVDVEDADLVAAQAGRVGQGAQPTVDRQELDDAEVHRLLVDLEQQRERDADARPPAATGSSSVATRVVTAAIAELLLARMMS